MNIEGIPDGWVLVRVGYVRQGEHYMGLGGDIIKWDHSGSSEGVYPIIRKIEKPERIVTIQESAPPDDGGPAFPFSALCPGGPTVYKDNEGMTLRDYFAGQALTGITANSELMIALENQKQDPGFFSYEVAELMLKARSKQTNAPST